MRKGFWRGIMAGGILGGILGNLLRTPARKMGTKDLSNQVKRFQEQAGKVMQEVKNGSKGILRKK